MNKVNMKIIKLVLFCILLPIFFQVQQVNATSGYPYESSRKGLADSWGFITKNCTSYVAWKVNQSGTTFNNWLEKGRFGNAHNWDDNAKKIGMKVSTTPAVNSIAVWEINKGGAGGYGHVAWVEKVNSDGTIEISEYNWNGGDGKYNYRRVAKANLPSAYIYVKASKATVTEVTQTAPVSNTTVNSGGTSTITSSTSFPMPANSTGCSAATVTISSRTISANQKYSCQTNLVRVKPDSKFLKWSEVRLKGS